VINSLYRKSSKHGYVACLIDFCFLLKEAYVSLM